MNTPTNKSLLERFLSLLLIPLGALFIIFGPSVVKAEDTTVYDGCNGGACDPMNDIGNENDISGDVDSGCCTQGLG